MQSMIISSNFRYSRVKPLLQDLDELVVTALDRIQFSSQRDISVSASTNTSQNVTLDPSLWNHMPLVVIDENDPDNPLVYNIFDSSTDYSRINATGGNDTSYAERFKVAIQLVGVHYPIGANVSIFPTCIHCYNMVSTM